MKSECRNPNRRASPPAASSFVIPSSLVIGHSSFLVPSLLRPLSSDIPCAAPPRTRVNQLLLFKFMRAGRTGGRAGGLRPAEGEGQGRRIFTELRADSATRPCWPVLPAPTRGVFRVTGEGLFQNIRPQRVKLFQSEDGHVRALVLFAVRGEIVIHLARAKQHTFDGSWRSSGNRRWKSSRAIGQRGNHLGCRSRLFGVSTTSGLRIWKGLTRNSENTGRAWSVARLGYCLPPPA